MVSGDGCREETGGLYADLGHFFPTSWHRHCLSLLFCKTDLNPNRSQNKRELHVVCDSDPNRRKQACDFIILNVFHRELFESNRQSLVLQSGMKPQPRARGHERKTTLSSGHRQNKQVAASTSH